MRVTTDMIFNRTIFNLSRSLNRYMRVESMLSSGRRISVPSDDPMGTQHDLNYRSRLTEMEQYLSNISQGLGWMSSYESGLADLKDLYSYAKETAIAMANDAYDEPASREATAKEVEAMLEQVLQIANTRIDGRYVYSGHLTRIQAFNTSTNGTEYMGDRGAIEMELDVASRITSNLIGGDIFMKQLMVLGEGYDLKAGITSGTLLADLNNGAGVELSPGTFEIYDSNRGTTYTIDLSAAVTAGDVVNAINSQLGAGSNLSVKITDVGDALEWVTTAGGTNSITLDTPLANLNDGTGIDMQPGKIVIRNFDSSIDITVDISSATTIGDVLTKINIALLINGVAGVTAGFNADGNGLSLTDSNVPPLNLSVVEFSDIQTTAADLGILGSLEPSVEGRDLSPLPEFIIRDIGLQTTAADLGISGTIHHSTVGQAIRPQLTLDTAISSLNNLVGLNLGEIKISHGNQSALIDLGNSTIVTVADLLAAINTSGLEVSASINDARTGIRITPTVPGKTLIIESNDNSRTAHNLGIIGSPDMLGSMMLLIRAIREGDRDLISELNGNMDLAMDELLSVRALVGNRVIRMETTQNRLEASRINVTRLLSEVEDADIISLVSELAREENMYQAALVASSKMLQQSLVDFLR
jgi:flagellar hook-associated protein 3